MAPMRRRPSHFLFFFVLLSHDVWDCSACASSSPNRHPPSGERGDNILEEGAQGSRQYFTRMGRDDSVEPGRKFQYCHRRLTNALNILCKGQYHVPVPVDTGSESSSLQSTGSRKSIVVECCLEGCEKEVLMKYCRNRSGGDGRSQASESVAESQVDSELQAPEVTPASQPQDPDPAINSAFYYFLKTVYERFGHKPQPLQRPVNAAEDEADRDPPTPQARVQHVNTNSEQASFRDPVAEVAVPQSYPHRRHHHHHQPATNTESAEGDNNAINVIASALDRAHHQHSHHQHPQSHNSAFRQEINQATVRGSPKNAVTAPAFPNRLISFGSDRDDQFFPSNQQGQTQNYLN